MIILGIVIGIIIGIIIGACLAQVGDSKENENTKPTNVQIEKPINTQVEEQIGVQISNKELKIEILQALEQRYATASEIAIRLGITTQKATALLRQLYTEQKIQRLEIDGKVFWGQ